LTPCLVVDVSLRCCWRLQGRGLSTALGRCRAGPFTAAAGLGDLDTVDYVSALYAAYRAEALRQGWRIDEALDVLYEAC